MRPSGPRAIAGLLSLPNRRWKNQTYFILKIVASLAVRLAKNYSPCWRCSLANTSWALLLLYRLFRLPPAFHQDRDRLRLFQLCGSIQASLTFGLTRLQAFKDSAAVETLEDAPTVEVVTPVVHAAWLQWL